MTKVGNHVHQGGVEMIQCDYCGQEAQLYQTSSHIYSGRDYGAVWHCRPCGAWVGCHKGSARPLGRLANASLRRAKMEAHAALDRLWRDRRLFSTRGAAYAWLADRMGVERARAHIGMFDEKQCAQVVGIVGYREASK